MLVCACLCGIVDWMVFDFKSVLIWTLTGHIHKNRIGWWASKEKHTSHSFIQKEIPCCILFGFVFLTFIPSLSRPSSRPSVSLISLDTLCVCSTLTPFTPKHFHSICTTPFASTARNPKNRTQIYAIGYQYVSVLNGILIISNIIISSEGDRCVFSSVLDS